MKYSPLLERSRNSLALIAFKKAKRGLSILFYDSLDVLFYLLKTADRFVELSEPHVIKLMRVITNFCSKHWREILVLSLVSTIFLL